jgi:hypothetical protein
MLLLTVADSTLQRPEMGQDANFDWLSTPGLILLVQSFYSSDMAPADHLIKNSLKQIIH